MLKGIFKYLQKNLNIVSFLDYQFNPEIFFVEFYELILQNKEVYNQEVLPEQLQGCYRV